MGLATSLGLAVIALDLPLTPTEAGDGEQYATLHAALLGPASLLMFCDASTGSCHTFLSGAPP